MDNREADHAGHPPACTCRDCVARRLGEPIGRGWTEPKSTPPRKASPSKTSPPKSPRESGELPKGVLALLLVFALLILGFGISTIVGTLIPLWLLLGFSIICSIEKWFSPVTRRVKVASKLYRLALNLSMLLTLGLLVLSGVWLFSGQLAHSPLIGSLIFLAEFIFFIWLWKVISRNKWRWPSMKLTVFSLICLCLVFAFAGVQPLSSYKDTLLVSVGEWQEQMEVERIEKERLLGIEKAEEKAEREEQLVKASIEEGERARQQKINRETRKAEQKIIAEQNKIEQEKKDAITINDSERLAFDLINMYREENGAPATKWDNRLYELSKAHTQEMADKGEIFHGSGDIIGENTWGGRGYSSYSGEDLAVTIAASWATSPLHNAWLLYAPIKESAVSIVVTPNGQYASWTFWMNKLSGGPDLIMKISREYKNSRSSLDWISWLKANGYL